jgi:hypothetical protein
MVDPVVYTGMAPGGDGFRVTQLFQPSAAYITSLPQVGSVNGNDGLLLAANVSGPGTGVASWCTVAQLFEGVFGVVNVKSFGATGNGVTDDTAAIQAAMTSVASLGGTVFFPTGTYIIAAPINVYSNTRVTGEGASSVLKASAAWVAPYTSEYQMLRNVNTLAVVITDENITVDNLLFTYVNLVSVPFGGNHAIRFNMAQNIVVRDCFFYYGNNAVAFTACKNTLIEGCSAYYNDNCPYDHWAGPQDARVLGCYAESSVCVQMVNFNATLTGSDALVADGCVVDSCQLVFTGPLANTPVLNFYTLAPLGLVKNVVISNNRLVNVQIRGVGACENILIADNSFNGVGSTTASIACFGDGTGVPDNVTVTGNSIVDPTASVAELAVFRIWSNGYVIANNSIRGTGYLGNNVDCSTFTGALVGNDFSQGRVGAGINAVNFSSGTSDVLVPNTFTLGGKDASGKRVGLRFQSDNNAVFYTSNAAGNEIALFGFPMQNNTPTVSFNFRLSAAGIITSGNSGNAGAFEVYPATALRGRTDFTTADNTGNTTTTINTAAQAGARTYTVPDAGASATFLMTIMPALQASPSYPNDAAAAAGGVVVGQIYRQNNNIHIRIV